MDSGADYSQRKQREIAILAASLNDAEVERPAAASAQQFLEQKLTLAAQLHAEQCLAHRRVTETARSPPQKFAAGPYQFQFNYQRADLEVDGPPIYPLPAALAEQMTPALYFSSGMGAIATLLLGLTQLRRQVHINLADDSYDEARELMRSLSPRIRMVNSGEPVLAAANRLRVLWLDSSTHAPAWCVSGDEPHQFDLMVFDTTCLWRSSGRIRQVIQRSQACGVPLALIRSHTKLDTLGIEYGRLGSIALVHAQHPHSEERLHGALQKMRRLLGAAPSPDNFAPFVGHPDYAACSAERTAAIMRNTRRMIDIIRLRGTARLQTFQHGLYFTMAAPFAVGASQAAIELADLLAAQGLPAKHAGSFGFDFVAIDHHPGAAHGPDVLRIAGADLPLAQSDRIAEVMAEWIGNADTQRRPARNARYRWEKNAGASPLSRMPST